MKKLTKAQVWRELIPESNYPEVYSKRGFEKSRVQGVIPKDRTELAFLEIKGTNKIIML